MISKSVPKTDHLTFMVLGMHRSGTSALTHTLNLVGLHHAQDLLTPNAYNQTGYWEPRQVVAFNARLMKLLDRHWADPKPMPPGWSDGIQMAPFVQDAVQLLQAEFEEIGGIVVKDPRLSRTAPVWLDALEKCGSEPVCLIACRNPLEVHRSLNHRDNIGFDHAIQLWLTYMLDAEAVSRGRRRAFISYDALLQDWQSVLQSAFSIAELPDLEGFIKNRAAVDAFLDKGQRHHRQVEPDLFDHPGVSPDVKEVYALFQSEDGAERLDEFDILRRRWQADWDRVSPGSGRSVFVEQLPAWHVEQAALLHSQGQIGKAIDAVRKAIECEPNPAHLHHNLGNLLAKAERWAEAEAAQRQAISLDAGAAHFHRSLSGILHKLGRREAAIETAQVALDLDPGQAPWHHHLGHLFAQAGRLEEAESAQRQAIGLDPGAPQFHRALSGILHRLGRRDEALESLQLARTLDADQESS